MGCEGRSVRSVPVSSREYVKKYEKQHLVQVSLSTDVSVYRPKNLTIAVLIVVIAVIFVVTF